MLTLSILRRLGAGAAPACLGLAFLGLAGCAPSAGDGYGTAQLRAAQREAAAAARGGAGPAAAPAPFADTTTPGEATAVAAAAGHVGLSDEQDFDAVSARESIESDKERLQAQRAAYQQIAAEALPQRPVDSDTPIIDFALSTTNALGEAVWPRPGGASQDKFIRACARYPSQDVAQAEFLKAGGPQSDRRGVDPDGDGFACFWDPGPFRLAREGAVAAPVAREVLPGEAPEGTVGAGGTMVRTSDYDQTPLQ